MCEDCRLSRALDPALSNMLSEHGLPYKGTSLQVTPILYCNPLRAVHILHNIKIGHFDSPLSRGKEVAWCHLVGYLGPKWLPLCNGFGQNSNLTWGLDHNFTMFWYEKTQFRRKIYWNCFTCFSILKWPEPPPSSPKKIRLKTKTLWNCDPSGKWKNTMITLELTPPPPLGVKAIENFAPPPFPTSDPGPQQYYTLALSLRR